MIMYFTYISPEASIIYNESDTAMMQENILQMKLMYNNAMIFVARDLNARIRDLIDFIPDDNLYYLFGDTEYALINFTVLETVKTTTQQRF